MAHNRAEEEEGRKEGNVNNEFRLNVTACMSYIGLFTDSVEENRKWNVFFFWLFGRERIDPDLMKFLTFAYIILDFIQKSCCILFQTKHKINADNN